VQSLLSGTLHEGTASVGEERGNPADRSDRSSWTEGFKGGGRNKMVTLKNTSTKYRGRMAANYEKKRSRQLRWKLENDAVRKMLADIPKGSEILDAPVGQGRFLPLYQELGFKVVGVDSSEEMLLLAGKRRMKNVVLQQRNITDLKIAKKFHTAVCVRFLDLIPEDAMRAALRALRRATKHNLILTIRLGSEYVPKVNTALHDQKKFFALIKELNWRIEEDVPIFKQGWHVFKLVTGEKHVRRKTKILDDVAT
jgi:SAM-dependent methyltransferase